MTDAPAIPTPDPASARKPGFASRTARGLVIFASWLLVLILLIGAMVYLLYLFTPWQQTLKDILSARLRTEIVARTGAQDVDLTLSDITLTEANVSDLRIGGEGGLSFGGITLTYDPHTLWQDRRIAGVVITAPVITLAQDESGWQLKGLPAAADKADPMESATLPASLFSPATYSGLPLDFVRIENGRMHLDGQTLKGTASLTAETDFKDKTAGFTLSALSLTAGKTALQSANAETKAAFNVDKSEWSGDWTAQNVTTNITLGEALPPLSAKGSFSLNATHTAWTGTLTDKSGDWTASFTADIPLDGKAARLTLTSARLPWMDGRLSLAEPLNVPLTGKKDIRANIKIESLSIDRLLQAATGSRVTATGTVSGTIPFILKPDGSFDIGTGLLEAAGDGRLTMPAEALPGDNPQVGLLRDVMSDFRYSALSVEASKDDAGKTALTLRLSGNNPAVQNGREVKLNVNLTGDILSLIHQNMLLMTDPQQFLRQQQ